jgi:hypothetical protein
MRALNARIRKKNVQDVQIILVEHGVEEGYNVQGCTYVR